MEPLSLNDLPAELVEQISMVTGRNVPTLQRVSQFNNALTNRGYSDICNNEPIKASEVDRFLSRVTGCGDNEFRIFFSFRRMSDINVQDVRLAGTSFDSIALKRIVNTDTKNLKAREVSWLFVSDDAMVFNDHPAAIAIARQYGLTMADMKLASVNTDKLEEKTYYLRDKTALTYVRHITDNVVRINLGGQPVYPDGHHLRYGIVSQCSPAELDFATQHYIFSQRIGCVKRNPRYANDRVIAAIRNLVASSDQGDVMTILSVNIRFFYELRIAGYFSDDSIHNANFIPVPKTITAETPIVPAMMAPSLQHVQQMNRDAGAKLISFYTNL